MRLAHGRVIRVAVERVAVVDGGGVWVRRVLAPRSMRSATIRMLRLSLSLGSVSYRHTFNLLELNLRRLHIRIGDPNDEEAFRRNDRNIYVHGFAGHFVAGKTRVRDMNVYGMIVWWGCIAVVVGSRYHIFSVTLQSTRYSPVVANEEVVSAGNRAGQYRNGGGTAFFRHEEWVLVTLIAHFFFVLLPSHLSYLLILTHGRMDSTSENCHHRMLRFDRRCNFGRGPVARVAIEDVDCDI